METRMSDGAAGPPAEPVRLVIWDLDDTFWAGTLSEGGISWIEANAEAVRELSRRGIVNSICSKNTYSVVAAVLASHDLSDYFVFSSISWESKGPRLAALVDAVQLRPESVLFIDDNPMNRAEALHYLPKLQVADEKIVPGLLADPRLQGKKDAEMKRLAQYRLLERRQADQAKTGADSTAFLRESGITVAIEHDLAPHVDRVIEIINRTNQLNFTKRRLPEEPRAAREAVRALLAKHTVQAGILRVRDRYGDYGYCGLYVILSDLSTNGPLLLHFAFSCRILGMGIESWLYQRLARPRLNVVGDVVADVIDDRRAIDWVTLEVPETAGKAPQAQSKFAYILARGGCDMRAIAHYAGMVSPRVIEEIPVVRDGQMPLTCSSVMAVHAIHGAPELLVRDSAKLGFLPEDFGSVIAAPPQGDTGIWLLNFTLEQSIPVLRHVATGMLLPAWIMGLRGPAVRMLIDEPSETGLDPSLRAHLREHFEMAGLLPDDIFRENLRLILGCAPASVRVFVLLANEQGRGPDGTTRLLGPMRERNASIVEVAKEFPSVELVAPADFMSAQELAALEQPHHYDRLVYFRIFQHVMARLSLQA